MSQRPSEAPPGRNEHPRLYALGRCIGTVLLIVLIFGPRVRDAAARLRETMNNVWHAFDNEEKPPAMGEGDWGVYESAGENEDETVIYDKDNPTAWVQSDTTAEGLWDE